MATTTTSPTNSARTVTGLIGFAVLFSLLGVEIKVATGQSTNKLGTGLGEGGTIIVGGFIAAALLTALSGAGEAGRQFSVGLATVTMVTATLVYGKPVWDSLNTIVGGKPTGATADTGNTTATTPSTDTTDSAVLTAVSLGG